MAKRGYGILEKIIISLLLILTLVSLSGCSDSELEQENRKLKSEFTKKEASHNQLILKLKKVESNNKELENNLSVLMENSKQENRQLQLERIEKEASHNQLILKLKEVESNNKELQKNLSLLMKNNEGLKISLAKSELVFSQKYKTELDTKRNKIDIERKKFKEKRGEIEKDAYENAKTTVMNKYMGVLLGIFISIASLLIFWFFSRKKIYQIILEKNIEIDSLKNEKKVLESENEEQNIKCNALENTNKDLMRKEKEGTKNQVVSKIEMHEVRREQALNNIGGLGNDR